MQWTYLGEGQWVIANDAGTSMRTVRKVEPSSGGTGTLYTVTGHGYEASVYATLEEAKAAAETSLKSARR